MPCLLNRYEEGGEENNAYLWLDLLVASWVFASKPLRHMVNGSRVDGYVAHLASSRNIGLRHLPQLNTIGIFLVTNSLISTTI